MKTKFKVAIVVALIGAAGVIIGSLATQSIHISINLPQTSVTSSNISDSTGEISSTPTESSNTSIIESSTNISASEPGYTSSKPVSGNVPSELVLYADNQNGKWGYVDQFENEIIPHVYDWADDFIDEYAAVLIQNSWGFIDSNGKEVISFEFNGAWSFINGLAPVYNGDKWGFIDKNGNIKIPFKFANIYRTYSNGHQIYTDENDNIIDYDAEINNNAINSTTEASNNSEASILSDVNTQTTVPFASSGNENIQNTVPIRDFLSPYVSATRDGSNLTISVDKNQVSQLFQDNLNGDSSYPFHWGLYLTNGLENDKTGAYIIELELCIDSDHNVTDTSATAYIAKDEDSLNQVQQELTELNAYFDGEKYIISCDISNNYISPENICINNVFCY